MSQAKLVPTLASRRRAFSTTRLIEQGMRGSNVDDDDDDADANADADAD